MPITATDIAHRGGRTFGYRVEHETGSLAYLPDHGLGIATPEHRAAAEELVRRVDVLLHGGGYLEQERAIADEYGHATVDDAIALATTGDVGRLVLIHHAPRRTDAEIAAIERQLPDRLFPIEIGREGTWVDTQA